LVDGSLETRVRLPMRHNIELFSLVLTVEALQGKTCQDSLHPGEGRSASAKISGGRVVLGNIFWFLQN